MQICKAEYLCSAFFCSIFDCKFVEKGIYMKNRPKSDFFCSFQNNSLPLQHLSNSKLYYYANHRLPSIESSDQVCDHYCQYHYPRHDGLYGLSMVHNQASDAIGHLRDCCPCFAKLYGDHPPQTNCYTGNYKHPSSCMENQYPCR